MYSVPMHSLFPHQFQFDTVPNNGLFLKKDVLINPQAGQLMPPMAHHSSQALSLVTPTVPVPSSHALPTSSTTEAQAQKQEEDFILEHHVKTNKNHVKPYQCNYCNKAYKQTKGIKNHVKLHLQRNEATQNCSTCGKTFTASPVISGKPFLCNNCIEGKRTNIPYPPQQNHQPSHQPNSQNSAHHQHHNHQQQFILALPSSHVVHNYLDTKPQPTTCHDDSESCPESEKLYSCQYCQKRFQHPSTLKMHLKRHTDDKPFICNHCNKNFKRHSSLKIHERTHTGDKTHECTYCGKLFAYDVFLKVHLRKHTGEKPYHCHLCDKTFTQAGNLKSHVKRKHGHAESLLMNMRS